ncbi:MAG: replication protein P [Gammaproteobacteria bacterium]|jgi:hypothetical protein|nr:replication protein P [Gammaproteobacteria bacterium]MDP7455412.1 replication protein P [Gammaproteobacteria bacterium]HJO11087.1 replication protein P [Gammaproteobacteria bacterium]
MQKISSLLERASKELKTDSSASQTAVGPSKSAAEEEPIRAEDPVVDRDSDASMDHIDAINQLFAELEFAYHNQFHKAFGDAESLVIAKKYWLSCLSQFSPLQITLAVKSVIKTQEYLPSIATIVRTCESGLDLFGLPSAREAYIEACGAPSPKASYAWSHEAVYCAGKASGWFLLANELESSAFQVFDYHYKLMCRRVMAGESLAIEIPAALPDKNEQQLEPAEVRKRIKKLQKELGL